MMTEQEAISTVQANRGRLGIRSGMKLQGAEKAIVEYSRDRKQAGPVEDRVAWIVTYVSDMGFAEVRVDNSTGEVLEVLRAL